MPSSCRRTERGLDAAALCGGAPWRPFGGRGGALRGGAAQLSLGSVCRSSRHRDKSPERRAQACARPTSRACAPGAVPMPEARFRACARRRGGLRRYVRRTEARARGRKRSWLWRRLREGAPCSVARRRARSARHARGRGGGRAGSRLGAQPPSRATSPSGGEGPRSRGRAPLWFDTAPASRPAMAHGRSARLSVVKHTERNFAYALPTLAAGATDVAPDALVPPYVARSAAR